MLLALVFFVTLQTTSGLPDLKNFKPVLSKELEFRIDDCKTGFVGQVVVYQSPDDPNEFVRVYYRQVAIVSERPCENDSKETGGPDRNSSNLNYHLKQETEALDRVQRATDAFAYIQWRTVRDQRTGQDIRADWFRSWLLDQNGNWALTYGPDYNLLTSPFSEQSKTDPKKRIIVGIQFSLSGGVHIVRIDQDDILAPVEKDEAVNE